MSSLCGCEKKNDENESRKGKTIARVGLFVICLLICIFVMILTYLLNYSLSYSTLEVAFKLIMYETDMIFKVLVQCVLILFA